MWCQNIEAAMYIIRKANKRYLYKNIKVGLCHRRVDLPKINCIKQYLMGQLFIGCTGVIKLGLIWTLERQFVKTFTALIVFSACCLGQGWRSIILFSKAWYHCRQGQISIMCLNHFYCVISYYHKTTICCIIIFGCQFSLCIILCITSLFLKKKCKSIFFSGTVICLSVSILWTISSNFIYYF